MKKKKKKTPTKESKTMTVLFTTYSAKRVFIKTDTVLSLQHCRPPTGTKGESEDEKERKWALNA